MEPDHLFHLNYAITLANAGEIDRAQEQFSKFESIFQSLPDDARTGDSDVMEQRTALAAALGVALHDQQPSSAAMPAKS
jgi:Bardet-Biedl syndrome 4 protein